MAERPPSDVSIGKFDILATYAYARALLDGLDDDEAKQRGMVAAIMGVQARLGIRKFAKQVGKIHLHYDDADSRPPPRLTAKCILGTRVQ
jgi:hypothetical protein